MAILSNNLVANAGFLRGVTDWSWTTSGFSGTVLARETGVGAMGRAVLHASASASSAGWLALSAPQALPAGRTHIEVCARIGARTTGCELIVQSLNASSAVIATDVVGSAPAVAALPVAGLENLVRVWASVALLPLATQVRIGLRVAAGGAFDALVSRPVCFAHDAMPRDETRFDPGNMAAQADLNLPVWPRDLSPFFSDAVSWAPRESRIGFEADNGATRDRRMVARPRRQADFTLRCSPAQREILVAFERAQVDRDFWMVDPVDDTLCRVRFRRDGAPRLVGHQGFTQLWSVGLETRIA
jgi:hypothetical protein